MFNYRKMQLMPLLVLGLLGGSLAGWADEPMDVHPNTGQSANPSGGQKGKMSHGLYGPMNLSYIEIGDLDLSPKQEELWSKAQKESEEAFERMRIINRDLHDQIRVDLDQPGADLKQVIQRQEEARTKIETAFKQARAAWVTAYDSLSAAQKDQLRTAIRDGMDAFQTPFPPPPTQSGH